MHLLYDVSDEMYMKHVMKLVSSPRSVNRFAIARYTFDMLVSRSHWYVAALVMLLFLLTAGSAMAAPYCVMVNDKEMCDETVEVSVEGTDYACYDADGHATACKGGGPPSTTAKEQKGPELLSNTCLEMFPELGKGTASISSKDLLNNPALCQAYKNLYNRFIGPGECTANSGVTKLQAITGLNADFAMALDKLLQQSAMKKIQITSAYRKNPCPNANGVSAQNSNHMVGCAVDLGYSAHSCSSPECQFMRDQAPSSGLWIRIKQSPEWNHIEPVKVDVCRQKGPGGGVVPGGGYLSAQWQPGADPAQGQGPGQGKGPTQARTGQSQSSPSSNKDAYPSATYKSGNNNSSIFGGNSEFGKMMQMMMAMQLMQGMSQGFGGLFGNTGNAQPTTSATPAPYTPYQQPVSPFVPTNTSSNSDIDALIASLNKPLTNLASTSSTSGTMPPPTSSGSVGQLQTPPLSTHTDGSFLSPTSGIAPFSVKAHFTSGTSCSDAFDLSWGDGYRASMPYTPPQNGSACSALTKINDIEHVYTIPGAYTVVLKSGKDLSSVRSATVTVSAPGSPVSPPAISPSGTVGSGSSQSGNSVLGALAKIGRVMASFGKLIWNAVIPGSAPAQTPTPQTAGATATLSLPFNGVNRTYIIHVPTGYDATKKYPLMISFHGMGGTGAGQREKTGFDAVADANEFFVAYPNAIGGQWQPLGEGSDVDFSLALIQAVQNAYSIDASRVYVSGFSMGGGMAQAVACAAADKIAGMANVSNNLGPNKAAECHPSMPVTTVHFHGTADTVSLYTGGNYQGGDTYSSLETAQFWATKNSCISSPTVEQFTDTLSDGAHVTDTMHKWNSCSGGSEVIFYTITGGGHAWPGSTDEAKYGPSSGINASQIIWIILSQAHR